MMNEGKMDVQGLEPWTSRNPIAKRARYHCAKRPCNVFVECLCHEFLSAAGIDGPRVGRRCNLAEAASMPVLAFIRYEDSDVPSLVTCSLFPIFLPFYEMSTGSWKLTCYTCRCQLFSSRST